MSANTSEVLLANVQSVNQFLTALASEVKSKKTDLELRRVRKLREKKRLALKGRQQRERLEKLAMAMKATESNLLSVNHEISMLTAEIAQSIDTEYD